MFLYSICFFLFFKNVGNIQSGKHIKKKHFKLTETKFPRFINNRIAYCI